MPRSKKFSGFLIAIEESRTKKSTRVLEARISHKQKRILLSIMREFGIKLREVKEPAEESELTADKIPLEDLVSMPDNEFSKVSFGAE